MADLIDRHPTLQLGVPGQTGDPGLARRSICSIWSSSNRVPGTSTLPSLRNHCFSLARRDAPAVSTFTGPPCATLPHTGRWRYERDRRHWARHASHVKNGWEAAA